MSVDLPPPPRLRSLHARRTPLAEPAAQLDLLNAVPLPGGDFDAAVRGAGAPHLAPGRLDTLQLNLGKLCNMTCRHCHVDAGPDRTEQMSRATLERALAVLDRTDAHTVDLTGGAPELHEDFRWLVEQVAARGKHVIDRCNLTVLLLPRFADLPDFLGQHGVEVVASLPHVRRTSTDAQRGEGTFTRSLEALQRLNAAGYGQGDPRRRLTLVHNPAGAFLPGSQASMEREWKATLAREAGVTFDRLIALTNMPISRFLEWLDDTGNLEPYLHKLVSTFNPATLDGLMCLTTLSVGWDGTVYDCDFNQMLALPVAAAGTNLHDLDLDQLGTRRIRTGRHCFGCTAGAGSSCSGAVV